MFSLILQVMQLIISSITIEKYSNWMFDLLLFFLKMKEKAIIKAKKEELEEWLKR